MKRTEEREVFKMLRYREATERDARAGLGGLCVLCFVGVRGGSYLATDRHEILSKAELPGADNWQVLFSLENIAPTCRLHHSELGYLRRLWLGAMVRAELSRADVYRVPPFAAYWDDRAYPPTMECVGDYGYGTRYFQSNALPHSLERINRRVDPAFNAHRYCESCPQHVPCRALPRPPAHQKEETNGLKTEPGGSRRAAAAPHASPHPPTPSNGAATGFGGEDWITGAGRPKALLDQLRNSV